MSNLACVDTSQLVDVFLIHEDMNLVFEFCATDLESILMEQSVVLKPEHIKCHTRMLLDGIAFLHKNFVLHRVRTLSCTFVCCVIFLGTCQKSSFGTRVPVESPQH